MAKIPFDIKFRSQIESGEYKVETRDGRPARIVYWDYRHSDYALVVILSSGNVDSCGVYTIDGKFYYNTENEKDLIIITPEPELKESEDERIRNGLIHHLQELREWKAGSMSPIKTKEHYDAWIIYLEKQREQKPSSLPEFVWHRNTWPWGKSVRIIKSDGSAVIDMYFVDDNPGVCQISGLLVEESQRRKGFAKRLMDVCEAYCLEHGIFRIDLDSVLTDWVQEFYMRRGFFPIKERDGFMQMRKLLKQK